jgi:predicted nucleic acid-binding protein
MLDPASGPFLFDTSAESWFAKRGTAAAAEWMIRYLTHHPVHVSSVTVFERARGYALLRENSTGSRRESVETARLDYVSGLGHVWSVDTLVATLAGEICALLPNAPTPPKRSQRAAESRSERLARWRADTMIAATALANDMLLLHNNAADFEAIRTAVELRPERFAGLGPLKLMRCAEVL